MTTMLSRQHLRLTVDDGSTVIEDLGSTNGTFVNSGLISGRQTIRGGDRIQAGGRPARAAHARGCDRDQEGAADSGRRGSGARRGGEQHRR